MTFISSTRMGVIHLCEVQLVPEFRWSEIRKIYLFSHILCASVRSQLVLLTQACLMFVYFFFRKHKLHANNGSSPHLLVAGDACDASSHFLLLGKNVYRTTFWGIIFLLGWGWWWNPARGEVSSIMAVYCLLNCLSSVIRQKTFEPLISPILSAGVMIHE